MDVESLFSWDSNSGIRKFMTPDSDSDSGPKLDSESDTRM